MLKEDNTLMRSSIQLLDSDLGSIVANENEDPKTQTLKIDKKKKKL